MSKQLNTTPPLAQIIGEVDEVSPASNVRQYDLGGAAEKTVESSPASDLEGQVDTNFLEDSDFPDGGVRAWLVVVGVICLFPLKDIYLA